MNLLVFHLDGSVESSVRLVGATEESKVAG